MLFWLIMVLLAVLLWRMAHVAPPKGRQMSYSEFLDEVDRKNIQAVALYPARDTVAVRGTLRDTGQEFSTMIPRETLPALTQKLRQQGATIDVKQASEGGWLNLAMNALPLIILVALWIFMMRAMRAKGIGK